MASSRKSVVCKICFSDNNETIDLIKTICRDKVKHQNSPRIRVYWDGTSRCLEQVTQGSPTPIRPFPPNWIDRGRRFVLCHGVDKCYGPDCYYPHSLEEQDVWNSKLSSSVHIDPTPKEPPPPEEYIGTSEDYPSLPATLPKPASVPSWSTVSQRANQTRTVQDSPPEYVQSRAALRQKQVHVTATQFVADHLPIPVTLHSRPQPTPMVTAQRYTQEDRTWEPAREDRMWEPARQYRADVYNVERHQMPHFQGSSLPFKQPPNVLPSSRVGVPLSEQAPPISRTSPPTPRVTPAQTQQAPVVEWPTTDGPRTSNSSDQVKVEDLLAAAAEAITYWRYNDKFLALLDLEQMEHDRILKTRCNGRYVLSLCPTGQELEIAMNDSESDYERYGYILGLNGDQIAYCTQASSGLTLVGGIEAVVLSNNMYHTDEKLYVAFDKKNSQKLKSELFASNDTWDTSLDVTFTLKYSYFEGLRRSVKNIQPDEPNKVRKPDVLRKISPQPGDFRSFVKCSYSPTIRGLMSGCSVDQREALEAILSCPPSNSPPILITGAFGTGKTRILAVAACCLLEQGKERAHPVRILASSHRQKSPDTFLEHYYGLRKDFNYDNAVVIRLQKRERYNHDRENNIMYWSVTQLRKEMHRIKGHRLFMLACTYGSALALAESLPGFFTHILIDEGAQSREPEALSPLRLANENATIVIAGDQHQVGPRTLVLGEAPQQHGLAVSLLQRLYNLYRKPDFKECARQYSYVLTTNFRCHPDILKLLGELFYEVPLTCHRPPPLHPLAKSSFIFVCSSIDQGAECVDPSQPFDEEARVLLEEVTKYVDSWPREWGYRDTQDVCLMCPARHQLTTVQRLQSDYPIARSIKRLPIYDMQGEEFRACFISTTEPTWKDGSSRNPTKSICDPYVFNTALTRARSLVVAVGNPFLLLKIEKHMVKRYGKQGRGWSTYIRECLARGWLSISSSLKVNAAQQKLCMNRLRELTGLSTMSEPVTRPNLSPEWQSYSVPKSQPDEPVSVRARSAHVPVQVVHPHEDCQRSDLRGVQFSEDSLYYASARPRELGVRLPKEIDGGQDEAASKSSQPLKKHTPPLDIRGPGTSRLEKEFEIVEKLGEGELSVVYRVKNKENQKESAIKVIALPHKIADFDKTMADVKLVSRLHDDRILRCIKIWSEDPPIGWKGYNLWDPLKPCEEARIVPCSTQCPYSPEVLKGGSQPDESIGEDIGYRSILSDPTSGPHPNFLYVQTEICTEGTLSDWLLNRGDQRGLDLFDQMLDAVAYIHEKGFVHRNLKPSNIFLFKNSRIKVGDFGFVTNELKYKPSNAMSYYRSPEQLGGETCTEKADIFSLGIILFELTYDLPHQDKGKIMTQLHNHRFPPGFESDHIHEVDLIGSMIAKDPSERPSANEIKDGEQLKKVKKSAKKQTKKSGKK